MKLCMGGKEQLPGGLCDEPVPDLIFILKIQIECSLCHAGLLDVLTIPCDKKRSYALEKSASSFSCLFSSIFPIVFSFGLGKCRQFFTGSIGVHNIYIDYKQKLTKSQLF